MAAIVALLLPVEAARVSGSTGAVLDDEPIEVSWPLSANFGSPSVASNGESYLVVWTEGVRTDTDERSEVHGGRVRASDGALLDAHGRRFDSSISSFGSPVLPVDTGGAESGSEQQVGVTVSPEDEGPDSNCQSPDVASDGKLPVPSTAETRTPSSVVQQTAPVAPGSIERPTVDLREQLPAGGRADRRDPLGVR